MLLVRSVPNALYGTSKQMHNESIREEHSLPVRGDGLLSMKADQKSIESGGTGPESAISAPAIPLRVAYQST